MTFSWQICSEHMSDTMEYMSQNEPKDNEEEILVISAENYTYVWIINENDKRNDINWCCYKHLDIVPENIENRITKLTKFERE